jgi:hypothetical protein
MSLIADMARAARLALPTLAAAPTAQKALSIRTAADAIRALVASSCDRTSSRPSSYRTCSGVA